MKKKIVSCVLSLAMCLSIIAGGTYALFTSEAKTNIAIASGKVEVLATINTDSLELYSPSIINKDGTVPDEATNAATKTNFANGGTATFSDNKYLTLSDITPGDNATFDIKIENNSTIDIKYQTVIAAVGDNADLLGGLEISVTTGEKTESFTGTAIKTAWTKVEANAEFDPDTITVEVKLPASAGNDWQELSAELAFTIFAVQANTDTEDKPMIFNANQEFNLDAIGIIEANGSNGVIQVVDGATVTVVGNGTVNAEMAEDNYAMAVWANGGNVVIEGGNYVQSGTGNDASYDMIYASNGGNITITGGTFKSATPAWTLNVKDADRETSHITVMGGRFYQFDPSNAQTGEGEITVHEDYKVVQNGDWYEVVEKMEYTTIDSLADFVDFANAVTANTLYKGYQVANNKYITASLTTDIDLAGVTGPAANANQFAIGNGSNTSYCGTFDGQGHTISNLTLDGNWSYYSAMFRTVGDGFTFKNVTVDTVNNVADGRKTSGVAAIVGLSGGGDITFDNVTVKNANLNGRAAVGVLMGGAQQTSVVNITNCSLIDCTVATSTHPNANADYIGAFVGNYQGGATSNGNAPAVINIDASNTATNCVDGNGTALTNCGQSST